MASARRHGVAAARPRRTADRRRAMGGAVSSAVLYLAIVALWAVVLVPMWLRRDSDAARPGLSWLPHRRPVTAPESAVPGELAVPGASGIPEKSALRQESALLELAPEAPHRWRGGRRGRGAVM